jgi:hypothetical protein
VIWLGPDELARAVNAPGRDRGSALRRDESAAEFAIRPLSGTGDPDDVPRFTLGQRIDLLSLLDDLF